MRNFAANLLTLLLVAGLVALAGFELARHEIAAPGPAVEPVRLTVERGARMDSVVERLEEAGAIDQPWLFRLAARYSGRGDALKFGEYEIQPGASMEEILAMVTTGGNVHHQVTVPEGRTVSEVVRILEQTDFLTGEIDEVPTEGSLLPETYSVNRGDTRQSVIARMQASMQQVLDEAWEGRDPDLPLKNKQELLTLASIVEKETTPGEHRRVASVFVNRLNKGMKLQTDPTVIYGITLGQGPLGRGLRRSELVADTPYNTYTREGLPPTPIANPGREAIMATANPDETEYFYFVADGTGGHAFATTLNEHNRNVAVWRRIEAQQRAEAERAAAEAAKAAASAEPVAAPGTAEPEAEPAPATGTAEPEAEPVAAPGAAEPGAAAAAQPAIEPAAAQQ